MNVPPNPYASAARPASSPWKTFSSWLWAFIPLLSVGTLGWVPAVHAWARLRGRAQLRWMVGLSTITVVEFVAISMDPTVDSASAAPTIATVLTIALIPTTLALGSIYSFRMRRRVFGQVAPGIRQATTDPRSMAAVARVEYARSRRLEARALVDKDPAMARELGIGRPDVPGRDYDDGGLVDLNHASVDAMVGHLDLTRQQAEEIATIRMQVQGFSSLDELGTYSSLPAGVIDLLRERATFVRY